MVPEPVYVDYLNDILDNIDKIVGFVAGMTLDDFQEDLPVLEPAIRHILQQDVG